MIQLHRPPAPPELVAKESAATKKLWKAWQKHEAIVVNPAVYNHPAVKVALRQVQHDKCAYCETINPSSHDVVEHFRPKNGWRQNRADKLTGPEYFWLGYDWENLLFACDVCNDAGHKQNLFPLENPSQRATAAKPDTGPERPLLLNPFGKIDPEMHIEWSRDVPRARKGSRRGRMTIEVFGLDRDRLRTEQRRGHLEDTETLIGLLRRFPVDHPDRVALRPKVLKFLDEAAPWSAMIRANLGAEIRAV